MPTISACTYSANLQCPSGRARSVYPGRRAFGLFPSILETQCHRSFRSQYCPAWIQSGVRGQGPSDHATSILHSVACDSTSSPIGRNKPNAPERGNRASSRRQSGVLLNFLSGYKKGRRLEAGPQFKEVEQVHLCEEIQDVIPAEGLAISQTRRLVGINRSKRCLFPHSDFSTSQNVSKVRFSEKGLSVSRSSIRAKHGTKSVYKSVSSSHRFHALPRSVRVSVLRRLSYRRKVQAYAHRFSSAVARSASRRGIYDQCQKISVEPLSGVGVSGNDSEYHLCKVDSAAAKGPDVAPVCLPVHDSRSVPASKAVSPIIRNDVSSQSHGPVRALIHETISDLFAFQMEGSLPEVVPSGNGTSTLVAPCSVVARSKQSHTGLMLEKTRSPSNPDNRRLRVSLGRAYERFYSTGTVDENPTPIAYQPFGDVGSTEFIADVSLDGRETQCVSSNGQHHSLPVHQQVRRDQVARHVQAHMAPVPVVHSTSGRNHGSASARGTECSGRQPVTSLVTSIGMDSESDSSRSDLPSLVHPRPRSFRHL